MVYRELQNMKPTVEMGVIWRRDDDNPVLTSFLQVVDEVSRRREGEQKEAPGEHRTGSVI